MDRRLRTSFWISVKFVFTVTWQVLGKVSNVTGVVVIVVARLT